MHVYIYVCICIVAHFGLKTLFSSTSVEGGVLCTTMDAILYRCPECQGLKFKEKNGRADGQKVCSALDVHECFRSTYLYTSGRCFDCREIAEELHLKHEPLPKPSCEMCLFFVNMIAHAETPSVQMS